MAVNPLPLNKHVGLPSGEKPQPPLPIIKLCSNESDKVINKNGEPRTRLHQLLLVDTEDRQKHQPHIVTSNDYHDKNVNGELYNNWGASGAIEESFDIEEFQAAMVHATETHDCLEEEELEEKYGNTTTKMTQLKSWMILLCSLAVFVWRMTLEYITWMASISQVENINMYLPIPSLLSLQTWKL
jgi:hypothetical protein